MSEKILIQIPPPVPSRCILDLVTKWEPHPEWPQVRDFSHITGCWGFAGEDGQRLHVCELYAPKPGFGKIVAFLSHAKSIYPEIVLELVMDRVLIEHMMKTGWVPATIRRLEPTAPMLHHMQTKFPPKRGWIQGMYWAANQYRGIWDSYTTADRLWDGLRVSLGGRRK